MFDVLASAYPWIKSLHVISVIAWMAGIFYLPRLFVYHSEEAPPGSEKDVMFQGMERRLFRSIMTPAMVATWVFGLLLAATPGIVDWGAIWPWTKFGGILAMSAYHDWLGRRLRDFRDGTNSRSGKFYRLINEVPVVFVIVIVVSVIARPF